GTWPPVVPAECPLNGTPLSSKADMRLLAPLLLLAACAPPEPQVRPNDTALADTLKARIEAAYDFSRPGVLERMNALYPDTGRVISASGGRVIASADSL